MAANIKHQFESQIADGADATLLRPSDWNNEHKAEGGSAGQAIVWDPSDSEQSLGWGRFEHLNYLFNADFELWGEGGSAAPSGWRLIGSGASASRTSDQRRGLFAATLTRNGADCSLRQDLAKVWGHTNYFTGKTITFGAWVKTGSSNLARISIDDGSSSSSSEFHTGSNDWEFLKVTKTIGASAAEITILCEVVNSNGAGIFDGAVVAICGSAELDDFIPSAWQGRKCAIMCGSSSGQPQGTTRFYGPWGSNNNEVEVSFHLPYRGIASNLRCLLDGGVPGGSTVTITFRIDEATDTPLALVISSGRSGHEGSSQVEVGLAHGVSVRAITSGTADTRFIHASFEFEEMPEDF